MGRRKSGKKGGKSPANGGAESGRVAKQGAAPAKPSRGEAGAKAEARGAANVEAQVLAKAEAKPGAKARVPVRAPDVPPDVSPGLLKDGAQRRGGKGAWAGSGKASGARRTGMGPAVFLPCLFLALVLGVYLGTLLPDMQARLRGGEVGRGEAGRLAAEAPAQAGKAADARAFAQKAPQPAQGSPIAGLLSRATLSPNDAKAWIELGNAYFDAGEAREAVSAYRRALEIKPGDADVLTDMGIMYRELGDFAQAVECFRRAQAADPRHANALFNEGVVQLNDLKKPAEARRAWEKLLTLNPEARSPDGKRVEDILRLVPRE